MLVEQETLTVAAPIRQRIRALYRADESELLTDLAELARVDAGATRQIGARARQLAQGIRLAQTGKGGLDALLTEFSLSTEEGIVLMCLAEALLRVPDSHNVDQLIRDKLSAGDWAAHLGKSDSLFVNASAWGLLLTGKVVQLNHTDDQRQLTLLHRTLGRLGEPVIRQAVRSALRVMGTQFVLGTRIQTAMQRARKQEELGFRYSYDMLGEGARTEADAQRYLHSYAEAIEHIGRAAGGRGPVASPGISVKLSALHPRYEFGQRRRVMEELVPRLKQLALLAKACDIGLTVDAEEADRLELSLEVIEAVFTDAELGAWEGFGLAIQAYQKRAVAVVDWARELAVSTGRRLMVRLVKGAYWDTEIKRAQVEGDSDYPVFTSKPATDVAYLACAKKLLAYRDHLYPQFATHNAYTVAAILTYDRERTGYEFQRLHGMGEALFVDVMKTDNIPCRIYAPVGEHADLLAYLVRRLLENGANTSFVNNIVDKAVSIDSLLVDPVATVEAWPVKRNTAIPLPADLYGVARRNSAGLDLTDPVAVAAAAQGLDQWWQANKRKQGPLQDAPVAITNPADRDQRVGSLHYDIAADIAQKLERAHAAFASWNQTDVSVRATVLQRLADAVEEHRDTFMGLCIKEAGKTADDGVAEVREAVDFCRYYADQALQQVDMRSDSGRGVVLCISPWNFPLAIFIGQVAAALVTGNTVVAKAAEQTGLIALAVFELIQRCGLPAGVLEVIVAPGRAVGEQLVPDPRIQAVMFTGSTGVAKWLSSTLAGRADGGIPLIAETGGQNAMLVDSTALPEQVVDDVIQSAFHSAGQRCSALRVLFLQEEIADKVTSMLIGAMGELAIGDPAALATDVGPVIDQRALERLQRHTERLSREGRLHYRCELPDACQAGSFIAPHLFEIDSLAQLPEEVFGPVVHIIRYRAAQLDEVIEQINGCGFGLTLGVHSRIQAVQARVVAAAAVGNVYVNRNMVGAVVGVQPFGGRGLSGTGPKAGGPHYLSRLLCAGPLASPPAPAAMQAGDDGSAISLADAAAVKSDKPSVQAADKEQWHSLPVWQRAAVLRDWTRQWATAAPVEQETAGVARQLLARAEAHWATETVLPGPTGELNRLFVEPRGALVAYLDKADPLAGLLTAAVAALVTGNSLVCVTGAGVARALPAELFAAVPQSVPLTWVETEDAAADLSVRLAQGSVMGVVVSAGSQWHRPLRQVLADCDGPLLPLIDEPVSRFYLQRFVQEKTVSEDTTAAGGNASLMTLGESHEAQQPLRQAV
ncbi:bifunctional proline dehydrogenase/L-glutamate gamma-semialdehyde dehydrogenase PutA [Exilibacterium tricleocarpae]|uniref:Bifunctional protein PutA n=1 Tax=Exilibacterium tricleocarpae TaxID=2591008 RepID=A0A545SYZ3_9GAMM|nr:bifunctional proline dehydrogenase/L-glutamate gamma-semialdehyde dehydrogenase PutA [Exilibacterium tricleocarpae]TQV70149.1 bifunctional proline dehydrogenase/L-glutamate gamma-semialdehyde dehydrogenase PutA [Exilibacterium tricleocarpae]